MRVVVASLALCSFVLVGSACGGSSEPTEQEDTSGSEAASNDVEAAPIAEPAPVLEPEPEPEPAGPGQITVNVRVGTAEVSTAVRVIDAAGEVAAEGTSGQTFTVPAGQYTLWTHITDEAVMIDTPEYTSEDPVIVAPAGNETETIRVPTARVRIRVQRRGRNVRAQRVDLIRTRTTDVVASFVPGNDYIQITAGRYNAVVLQGGSRVEVEDLVFMEGATRDMPINIQ